MRKFFLVVITILPTLLTAQNGVEISNFSVGTGKITFDLSWKAAGMPAAWSDSAWVFVDYNVAGTLTRLPLSAGATLTATSASGVGQVIAVSGNNQGVWVVGNARTTSSFSATVVLPFDPAIDVQGACAYAPNYPPIGTWNAATGFVFTGTPPYTLTLQNSSGTSTITTGSPYQLKEGFTLRSFTDKTGAPGFNICSPPTAPTNLEPSYSAICNGSSVTLTASGGLVGSGAQFQWGKGTVGTGILGSTTSNTYSDSPTSTTTYWVRRVSTSSCGSTTAATATVTVYPVFTAGAISGALTLCAGGTPSAISAGTAAGGGNGTISYQWYKNSISVGTSGTLSSYTPPVADATATGSITYTRRAKSADCAEATASGSYVLTVIADPTVSVTAAQSICYNTAPAAMTATVSGGSGTTSYQWKLNSTDISGATLSTYAPAALTTTSTYSVVITQTVSGCGVTSANIVKTVYPAFTAGAISGALTLCAGGTPSAISAGTVAGGGTGTISYQWYKNGVSVGTSGTLSSYTPPVGDASAATSNTYTRVASAATCGTAATATGSYVLTVIAIPAVPTLTIGSNTCAGTGLSFSAAVPSGATGVEWTGSVTGTGSPKTTATTAGAYSAQVRAYTTSGTTCYSAYATAKTGTVIAIPAVPTLTIGSNTCAGTGLSFSAAVPSGATGVDWTGSVTGTGSPKTTATTAGAYSAQVRAYTTNGTTCYSAYAAAKTGTVIAIPAVPTLTIGSNTCVGTGLSFSAAVPSGATGVEWTGSVTGTGSPKTTATTAGNYSAQVRAYTTNGITCYSAYAAAKTGTVIANNTIALYSGSTNTSATQTIAMTSIVYNTTGATGVSASGLPAGVSAGYASNKVTISGTPSAYGTFNYTVTLTGGCGSIKSTGTINVVPAPPPNAKTKNTWITNGRTWSDAINVPACNKTTYSATKNTADCRNNGGAASWGYLYSWYYVNQNKATMCPSPWRVPTRDDFSTFLPITALCGTQIATGDLSSLGWNLCGYCDADGSFHHRTSIGHFWSSTKVDNDYAYEAEYIGDGGLAPCETMLREKGMSVRCVRD